VRFVGKTILITGAATGIGRAAACAFGREGANVMIGDIDERGEESARLVTAAGGNAQFHRVDVSDPAAVRQLVDLCVATFGGLECAFNNAGILPPTAHLHEVQDSAFDRVIAVDVKGVFYAMRAEIAHMLAHGGGAIVNTASVAGVIADPGMSAYVAAKHAVVGLTKSAAIEYARKGIRVNAIAPGLVATRMTQRWLDDPSFKAAFLDSSPIGRAAEPEEIVGTVLHLCSDAASFTNGQIAIIDGGQTAH